MKMKPNSPKNASAIAALAAREPRVGEQPHVEQRVGRRRSSHPTNAAQRRRAAPTNPPQRSQRRPAVVRRLDERPDQRGRCRRPTAAAPARSNRPGAACRDSGSSRQPATSATSATGTLTKKTEPQQKCSSRIPPVTGPSATASPETAGPDADRGGPLARVGEHVGQQGQRRRVDQRRRDAHRGPRGDQLLDGRRPGPRPARSGRTATRPTCSTRRRPNRSPRLPADAAAGRRTPGCTRPPPTAAGWSSPCSSRLSVGRATLTIVLSIVTSRTLRHRTREDPPAPACGRLGGGGRAHRRPPGSSM